MNGWISLFKDDAILEIIKLSLQVSLTAMVIGSIIGILAGTTLGIYNFIGKKIILSVVYTLMGMPPVLIGVIVYLLLSRHGILGSAQLLFTPTAMIIAQTILITPIVTGLTYSAISSNDKKYSAAALTLGANDFQLWKVLLRESRRGIITACLTAFGRAISEVGAVMLVGGNIEGSTRVMTTAMILETRQGNFNVALALGAVLLLISFLINFSVLWKFMFKRASFTEVIQS
ncbi:ABC transporter permease [Neobacillus sp. PS3-40]|uniref:ABC transporter permease n=1 Tax=Neobacillus sp. PS3-40 TaxID=3070679 RepID=UPI0027E0EFD6|nr:ABC transporter permease [Neobacillus sp. PS3-40]WML46188.1 ABC transporter permease [Neobacillus sp. PS3-40]